MICNSCALAGDQAAKASNRKRIPSTVVTLHQACTGCDCQHRVNGKRIAMKAKSNGN